MLKTVELETGSPVVASVVWLHGLGADGHDFEPIVPELHLPGIPMRFVFPHAPVRPVTINGGIPMRAWFDILGLERGSEQDEQGVRQSASEVRELIAREIERGVAPGRIVLAGFSQGGAIALHTGLRYDETLAGLLALSTYLPLQSKLDAEAVAANRKIPVFMAHGTMDPLVPATLGEETRDFLRQRDYKVDWSSYPMAHAVCGEEVADIRRWLLRTLDLDAKPEG